MNLAANFNPAVGAELLLTRIFDAPRATVFKAWTDPQLMAKWWGPAGFTNPVCEVDARAGGKILIHMRAPDGAVYPMDGVFIEVVVPERLVFTARAFDPDTDKTLMEDHTTVTFEDHGGKTKLTIVARVLSL